MGKNLFDYAIKELRQDAFILRLFDSWNPDNEIERILQHNSFKDKIKFVFINDED